MKTFTTITVIGLLAWIGFVLSVGAGFYDAFLLVSPAIFGIAAIVMYRVLRNSIADYEDVISTQIGFVCATAFIITAPYSVVVWLVITGLEEYKQPYWIPLTIAITLGLCVFAVFYLNTAAKIRKEKEAIAQGKRSHLEYLQNKLNFTYACVVYSLISVFVSGFIFFSFAETNSIWTIIPLLFFLGSFVLLISFVYFPHGQLKEKIATVEVEFLHSKIAAERDRHQSEKAQVNKMISKAAAFLEKNPETPHNNWQSIIPEGNESHLKMGAKVALRRLLEQHEFEQARSLLDYHDADEFNLLPVMEALNHYAQTGTLDLSPQTFKLTLEDNETAYEKLPCNWQKIHTYLAPLEDEIEQADILDSGNIYITDQRVFFVGKKGSETVYLNDISYMDAKDDALQFFRDEGLSEIFAFPTPHHAKYAELVIRELMGR